MKVAILINSYGLKALAKGQELSYWHVAAQGMHKHYEVPKDCLKVGEYEIDESRLPTGAEAVRHAVNMLMAKQAEVMAAAQQSVNEFQQQINDLLMLEAPK